MRLNKLSIAIAGLENHSAQYASMAVRIPKHAITESSHLTTIRA